MSKPIVLTGLRANSEFHIGNYLGGILPVVELQKKHAGECQVNMFVPDLHSFTTPIDHTKLYRQTIDNLKVFVAAGLNISDSDTYIYRQSYVPAHSELTWILDCFTSFFELRRMQQFEDKAGLLSTRGSWETPDVVQVKAQLKELFSSGDSNGNVVKQLNHEELEQLLRSTTSLWEKDEALKERYQLNNQKLLHVSAGLYNYPVLMAADILLYNAQYIPVGEDQKQHLELARDLAMRLNNKFHEEIFVVPEVWDKQLAFSNRDRGVRIRSLRNPNNKMSKSIDDPSGTIMLSDSPEEAAKKIMKAETDTVGVIKYDFGHQPGISNLLQMLALLTERPQVEVNAEWEGKDRYGDLKKAVAAATEEFLTTLQQRLAGVDEDALMAKLAADEKAMNQVANETLLKVQKAVGLRP